MMGKMKKQAKNSSIVSINNVLGPGNNFKSLQDFVREDYTDTCSFRCGQSFLHQTCLSSILPGENGKLWAKELYKQVVIDFSEYSINVSLTTADEILVEFAVDIHTFTKQNYEVFNKYMNNLVKHGLGSRFRLIKRGDYWGKLISKPSETSVPTDSDSNVFETETKVRNQTFISYSMLLPLVCNNTNKNNTVIRVHRAAALFDRAKVKSHTRR